MTQTSSPQPADGEIVLLDHGAGGAATARLLREVFLRHLGAPAVLEDAAVVEAGERVALSTDSFVVKPLFFPGGDIGRLAVCGTVNDLAVRGARPLYLTAAFVLEEGLEMATLVRVVASMAATAREAGVRVVAGDTKVVGRGEADGLYINTTGLGLIERERELSIASCAPGDAVLVSGPLGDHEIAVAVAREGFGIKGELASDCQPLASLAAALLDTVRSTRCMRDPTRGGLATTLCEIVEASQRGMRIHQEQVPVRAAVESACELLGLDPLYMACEGRLVAVVPAADARRALEVLRAHEHAGGAAIIGEVVAEPRLVSLATTAGGHRPLMPLEGAQLPRIC